MVGETLKAIVKANVEARIKENEKKAEQSKVEEVRRKTDDDAWSNLFNGYNSGDSGDETHIKGYTKKDGTYVREHNRKKDK